MPTLSEATSITSPEQLRAVAAARGARVVRQYRALAQRWEVQGEGELAALFDRLAEMKQAHVAALGAGAGATQKPAPGEGLPSSDGMAWHSALLTRRSPRRSEQARPPDDLAWDSALLTPYRALSLAVRTEEEAFAVYAEVAAHATMPATRELAENLARAELEHAAILRRARRTAFHASRGRMLVPVPTDLQVLRRLSAAWEAEAATVAGRAALQLALSRNAERYLVVAEQTKSEAILAEAQRLAAETLKKLAAMRPAPSAP